jgi:hypothetical protein
MLNNTFPRYLQGDVAKPLAVPAVPMVPGPGWVVPIHQPTHRELPVIGPEQARPMMNSTQSSVLGCSGYRELPQV